MGLTYCPERLTTIAMEAVGKIPTHLLSHLKKIPTDAISEDFKTRHVEPVCRYLNETIEAFVPPNMANDVTNSLLSFVWQSLVWYNIPIELESVWKSNTKTSLEEKCKQGRTEVRNEIINAVFHSRVTVIRCRSFEEIGKYDLYLPLFSVSSCRFRNIRVLDFGYCYFHKGNMLNALAEMSRLEEFSYRHCNKAILNVLSQSCAHIRSLDLRESKSICDDSADIIIKFKYLEKLFISNTSLRLPKILETYARLNVSDTGHCPENAYKVLMNTIEGCTMIGSLVHLPEIFPNITHLIVHLKVFRKEENFDRLSLKRMKKLTNLTIYQCSCANVNLPIYQCGNYGGIVPLEELLQPIGNQLLELHLIQINGVDLKSIAENCAALRRLEMSLIVEDDLLGIPVPEFKSVVFFDVTLLNPKLVKSIVSQMPNLKKLHMFAGNEYLVIYVVERLIRRQLEDLVINGCSVQVVEENIIFSQEQESYIANVYSFREDEDLFGFLLHHAPCTVHHL